MDTGTGKTQMYVDLSFHLVSFLVCLREWWPVQG